MKLGCRYSADEEEDIMTTLNRMETQYSSMFAESSNHLEESGGDDSEEEGEVVWKTDDEICILFYLTFFK